MKIYIALLKGINVGGHKKIPMAVLRELLSKSGFRNVQTYIQSGNVIFQSSEENKIHLEEEIQNLIKNHFGFEVSVLVTTNSELQAIFDNCPFSEDKKEESYFTILSHVPEKALIDKMGEIKYPGEEVVILNNCIYFYSAVGYGKSKYNNNLFERKLKVTATARNYKTMVKLLSLSAEN